MESSLFNLFIQGPCPGPMIPEFCTLGAMGRSPGQTTWSIWSRKKHWTNLCRFFYCLGKLNILKSWTVNACYSLVNLAI